MFQRVLIIVAVVALALVSAGGLSMVSSSIHYDGHLSMTDCLGDECNAPMTSACAMHCLAAAADFAVEAMAPSVMTFVAAVIAFFLFRFFLLPRRMLLPVQTTYRDPWAMLTIVKRE